MVYSKMMKVCIAISVIMFVVSTAVFATTDIEQKNDEVIDIIMEVLIKVQNYSWPIAVIIFLYALYQYFVVGSEAFEYKVNGQKLIVGLSVFMTILQTAPLIYAFVTI